MKRKYKVLVWGVIALLYLLFFITTIAQAHDCSGLSDCFTDPSSAALAILGLNLAILVPSLITELIAGSAAMAAGLAAIVKLAPRFTIGEQVPKEQVPITVETRGGIEGIGPNLRDYAINVEVRGGVVYKHGGKGRS